MEKNFIGDIQEQYINPNEFGGLVYDENELLAIEDVIKNKKIFRYADESETSVDLFEKQVGELFRVKYVNGFNSGTSALRAALFSIGVCENDRVLVSSYTFIASAASVSSLHAIPIPMEFNIKYGMDIEQVREEIEKGCKAIVIVHLQGRAFDIREIVKLAHEKGVYVIEDACQAFRATCDDIYAGTTGDIGVFSFQQNKLLTSGEGGIFITDHREFYEIGRNFSDQGASRNAYPTWDETNAVIGDNSRMSNIQGSILLAQLQKLNYIIERQKHVHNIIVDKLKELNISRYTEACSTNIGINILFLAKDKESADRAITCCEEHNVLLKRIWNKPWYKYAVYQRQLPIYRNTNLKQAQEISDCLLALPIPPILKDEQTEQLLNVIEKLVELDYLRGWF
jgi:Predicted pyridoxal phosphate-dependent enzyme apparently involved in regulation of cell wall biogenesis